MNKFIRRIENAASSRFLNLLDGLNDRRICGQSLVRYVPSVFRDDKKGVGGTGSQSTRYWMLQRIFTHIELTKADVFLDVGCGKGRVLAFLLKEKCPCPLYGVEHNEAVGRIAEEWAKRYDNVHILIGDAFALEYNRYTVLSLARSFLPVTFLAFVERLEQQLRHPIRLVYWYDQQSGYLLKDRPGWHLEHRGVIDRVHGIRVAPYPQSYSIWVYDPGKAEGKAGENEPLHL